MPKDSLDKNVADLKDAVAPTVDSFESSPHHPGMAHEDYWHWATLRSYLSFGAHKHSGRKLR